MIQVGPRKNKTRVLVLTVAALSLTGVSNAGSIPFFNSGPITTGNSFQYNYTPNLALNSQLDPAASLGATCPGPGGSAIACASPSTFFTAFTLPGVISAIPSVSSAINGWNTVIQNNGFTPSVNTGFFANSIVPNSSFMTSGPVFQAGPATLPMGDFEIFSNVGYVNQSGYFSTQVTTTSRSTTIQTTARTNTPNRAQFVVPEPSTVLLLGSGLGALLLRRKFSRAA